MNNNLFENLKKDFPASIVVFLVALPLCLGIALASGAPLYAGLIAGIVGGIVVGSISGSAAGVSGPAAGLAVIVLNAITDLGGYEIFLVAVVLAGVIQLVMGFAKAGIIAYYFPTSVIHGMLAGIGILIFLKQIPHAFGYDKNFEGDESFFQANNENTFSELLNMVNYINPGVIIITAISLVILLFWQSKLITNNKILGAIPGPLLAVTSGILLNLAFVGNESFMVSQEHLVTLPIASSFSDFMGNFTFPDFSALSNPKVYTTAVIIAVVASIETLLSVEATDKLDPIKRVTPTNLELKAQGIGNIVSGLIGGLPLTQVIVRSSANLQAGNKSKMSAVLHGFFILISIVLIPTVLNLIPLGTLAAILLIVGYKLAKPALFVKMYKEGQSQFLPFVITVFGILFTNLLTGIGLGLIVAVFIILRNNYKVPFSLNLNEKAAKNVYTIQLSESVTFLNKAAILSTLDKIPDNSKVIIDASKTYFVHHDVLEIIEDYKIHASSSNIELELIELYIHKKSEQNLSFKIINN